MGYVVSLWLAVHPASPTSSLATPTRTLASRLAPRMSQTGAISNNKHAPHRTHRLEATKVQSSLNQRQCLAAGPA